MKGRGARPPARPATLDADDDEDDDPLSPTPAPWSRRALAPPPPTAVAAAANGNAAAPPSFSDDDDDAPIDPDAPVDLSRIKSAPPGLAAASSLSSSQRKLPGVRGATSSLRALLGKQQQQQPSSFSAAAAPPLTTPTPSRRGPLFFLRQPSAAAAATRASASAAAAALAEQRAALQRRMATAFALDAVEDEDDEQGGPQRRKRQQQQQSAQAATALAAALAQGLGPGFGPPTERGAFWRAALHLIVTPAWALVLLLSWLCNQWQRLWRPIGAILWWGVDGADRAAPLAVEWLLWLLGECSLLLHVVATGTVLGVAGVTLRDYELTHGGGGGGARAHAAWLWARFGAGGRGGGEAEAAAAVATAAAAAATPAVTEAARVAAIVVLALYALSHYCMAAAMFRELDLRDATAAAAEQGGGGGEGGGGESGGSAAFGASSGGSGGGSYYFSDLVAFLGRLLDVLLHDVQLCAATVHGNRVLEGGAQLAFRGYEEARVAVGALLFTGPAAAVLAWAHYRGAVQGAVGGGMSAADVAGQLKEHLQQLGNLRALDTYEGTLRAAVALAAANTLEKLLRLSAVDPWAHDPGDGFPLLYVRSHAARLPASLVRDWLFRCRCALSSSGGALLLRDAFAHYASSVRGGAVGSALSDAHRARLLRKAAHVFCAPAGVARRRREAAMRAAAEAAVGEGDGDGEAGGEGGGGAGGSVVRLSPADVAGAPETYDRAALGGRGFAGGGIGAALPAQGGPPVLGQQQQKQPAGLRRRAPPAQLRALAADGLRPLGPRLTRAIADVLSDASYVHTVSLRDDGLEDDAICAVVLACLGTGENRGDEGGEGGGGDNGGNGNSNPELALTHLDLSRNRAGPASCASLARAMRGRAAASLRTLVLAGNPIRDEGAALLAEALRGMASAGGGGGGGGRGGGAPSSSSSSSATPFLCALERLDLSDTAIGPEGAIALGSALRHNASLRSLSLAGSRIGAVGVEALAKGLARGAGGGAAAATAGLLLPLRPRSRLLELDVSRTDADDRSAAAIAAMLGTPGLRLRRLAMAQTGVTDAGAQLICAALSGGGGGGGRPHEGGGGGGNSSNSSSSALEWIDVSGSPRMDPSWGRLLSHVLRGGGGGARGGARTAAG